LKYRGGVKRYTSARTNQKSFRLAAFFVTLAGVIGVSHLFHAFDRVRHAVANAPVAYGVLAFGLVLLLFAFRDPILAFFGWMTPTHCGRLVRDYLEILGSYTVTIARPAPDFAFRVENPLHRVFSVAWVPKPIAGIFIGIEVNIPRPDDPNSDPTGAWMTAHMSDIRPLYTLLMEVATHTQSVLADVHQIESPATGYVRYRTIIPRDLLSFEEFSNRLNSVEASFVMAVCLIGDLLFTLKERQEAATAATTTSDDDAD
jgi:hypothetical protein